MSLYFEDFQVDQTFQSRGRTVTETDVVMFAGLSGDHIELHTNAELSKDEMFGQRIAHGTLILAISTGLTADLNLYNDTVVAFYGIDRLRFTKPTFIGDTVRLTKRVAATEKKDDKRGLVSFETKVSNQRNETILVYNDKLLIKTRGE
ncbi:MAG: MaoC family dehydratase N-terminal domain-containing protein [Pyrinomonadaceae bacterium]|nr:MaoC family dehydratase N-terminal domain-containing protein [Pyrinomonadaceae bacterium]